MQQPQQLMQTYIDKALPHDGWEATPRAHASTSHVRGLGQSGEPDGASRCQPFPYSTAFDFDALNVARIHADDRAFSADAQVQMKTAVVDRER